MNYNVKQLREKISEHILGLGIDKSFLENPAFSSALSEIDNLISQMNMFENAEKINVKKENGKITFDWILNIGNKYSMSITSSSPETFKCVRIVEEKPYNNANGQYIKQKNVVEKVATISEHGFITITTNGSIVNNDDCEINKCNNYTWSEKKYYTPDGVMRDREYKHFKKSELTVDFNNATIDSILYIPRQAFDASSFWHDKYESRTLLLRDKLDTARIVMEDRSKGIKYNAITPLNQEHGLRDMVLPNSYESYPQNIVIPPLSKEEIETMIQRENNPKVREGLRKYAIDRTTYSYNSNEDKYFISEGITQSKNISR